VIKLKWEVKQSQIHKIIDSLCRKEECLISGRNSSLCRFTIKDDIADCSNCHVISLLWTSYKVLSNFLLSRLSPCIDKIIGNHECGSSYKRSTTDQMFFTLIRWRRGVKTSWYISFNKARFSKEGNIVPYSSWLAD
jgi:hypothetical protein